MKYEVRIGIEMWKSFYVEAESSSEAQDKAFAQMDEIVDSFPEEIKFAVCYFGLAFIAADDNVSVREQQVFERILG